MPRPMLRAVPAAIEGMAMWRPERPAVATEPLGRC